jgi:hypothetical protein
MERLFDEISELMAGAPADLSRIEHTLTDGYARALDLEAERWRIEKRLSEIAASLADGDSADRRREVSALVSRLDGTSEELLKLRTALGDLRRHADVVRASAA